MTVKANLRSITKAFEQIEREMLKVNVTADMVYPEDMSDVVSFIDRGVFRSTYTTTTPNWVVKIPTSYSGARQTIAEAKRFAVLYPYGLAPKSKLMYINGFPVLYVERLNDFYVYQSEGDDDHKVLDLIKGRLGIIDWTQTARTSGGHRVFSDLGH